ncbi:MAG: hypothetical protein WD708_05345 [Kiritimatiellia bacterium]
MQKTFLLSLMMAASIFQVRAELLSIGSASDLLDSEQSISLDGGISLGDAEAYGVRLNARASERWLWFASVSEVDTGTADGISVGGGILVTLPFGGVDVANGIKLSYHYQYGSDTTPKGRKVDADSGEITARYVVTGELSPANHLRWFAEAGFHFFQTSVSYPEGFDPGDRYPRALGSAEPGVEAGLLLGLTEQATVFGSAEYVEESRFNLGFRYRF